MRYLSLFSGVEAASLAWAPLGWECVGVAEIEPFPCAVLAHRFPGVPNLGSVTDITEEHIAALGPIDLVVGGSPCQDLSVAGKRAGLAGARSGLFAHQMRIFHAARHLCGARWLVWENVPGAFSTNRGRDFAVVVGEMAGREFDVPADGWGTEGVALGDNGLVEWAVLDAQWFGVAQRRRRVFAVLDTGDWQNRQPVILEPDSLRGDSAPSREAREGTAGGAQGGAGVGVPDTVGTLCANTNSGSYTGQDAYTGRLIQHTAHTLRAEGFDASEDGTGRGTPLVPVALQDVSGRDKAQNGREWNADGVAYTVDAAATQGVAVPLQEVGKRTGVSTTDPRAGIGIGKEGDPMFTLQAGAQHGVAISVALRGRDGGAACEVGDDVAFTLRASSGGGDKPHVLAAMQVRRLTPRECERLQGFPDDWTLIPYRGKPADKCPDVPRYKAIGNSMAVPVMSWIGRQIQAAQDYEVAPW